MARPIKQGLDYFPLDINLDNKIELFEAEFGLQGFGFIIKLFQKIYSNGYYYEWNEDELLLFAKKINADINQVNVYINSALKRDIFSKTMFEKYKILTSKGIQKRFLEAVKRRKQIEVIQKFFLIDIKSSENYKEFSNKIVFVCNNPENVDINPENVGSNTTKDVYNNSQSKVKESKVNKSITTTTSNTINNNIGGNSEEKSVVVEETFENDKVIDFYNKNIDTISDYARMFIKQCRDKKTPDELIIYAMERAIDQNKKTIAYIKGVLNNFEKQNITSVLEAEQAKEIFKKEKSKNKSTETTKKNNYNNYPQREYQNVDNLYANSKDKAKEGS